VYVPADAYECVPPMVPGVFVVPLVAYSPPVPAPQWMT
jgi:hypothetical protein